MYREANFSSTYKLSVHISRRQSQLYICFQSFGPKLQKRFVPNDAKQAFYWQQLTLFLGPYNVMYRRAKIGQFYARVIS